ncbi:MAG: D-hexose-6-phosphate mutarotase [Verrucomicrobiota bacterium]
MSNPKSKSKQHRGEFPRVTFLDGRGDLPMLEITTPWSSAEIYLHGAQVTHFKKHNEPSLLFLSQCSRFAAGQPIRGGIPIIFPWFGKPADKPAQHGFARIRDWELKEMAVSPDGSVSVRLQMPECANSPECPACTVDFMVTVNVALTVELVVLNRSDREFVFENCLHTYFAVGDIGAVSITGLRGVDYLDQVEAFARKTETNDAVRITSEVDRAYLNTPHTVEIRDASLKRMVRVEKEGSGSTVVWNPWVEKARAMQDFGDEEYQQMVCVESGNVATNKIKLPPGQTSRLKVKLSSVPLL